MGFDPQAIINSRLGIGLALFLGRSVPPGSGYRLAYFVADRIASRKNWRMVKAFRVNQWVVGGEKLSSQELDQAVQETLHNTAHSIYELYHYVHEPAAVARLFPFNPLGRQFVERQADKKEGAVVVGPHIGNFDLALQALQSVYLQGLCSMVLTLPDVSEGGYQWQYEMRKSTGMEIVPTTPATLRQAAERLRAGEIVLTGLDRPIQAEKYRPRFFGRPASLPVHHIYLALKARVPVFVVATMIQADGTYHFQISEPITMVSHPDRGTEIIMNAEAVLRVAEDFIRQAPQQWSMPFPVWPELMDQVP
jgi:KDO2-lipid IV(A) lauroyltransferase